MHDGYEIVYVAHPEESAWGILGAAIQQYNLERAGEETYHRVCFVLQTPVGDVAGGVLGEVFYSWLHIDLLWVQEDLRGRGYGSRLLAQAEEEARRLGARNAFLDTFSFQAPVFYDRHGYRVFGELPDFPPGHRRYFLAKEL